MIARQVRTGTGQHEKGCFTIRAAIFTNQPLQLACVLLGFGKAHHRRDLALDRRGYRTPRHNDQRYREYRSIRTELHGDFTADTGGVDQFRDGFVIAPAEAA